MVTKLFLLNDNILLSEIARLAYHGGSVEHLMNSVISGADLPLKRRVDRLSERVAYMIAQINGLEEAKERIENHQPARKWPDFVRSISHFLDILRLRSINKKIPQLESTISRLTKRRERLEERIALAASALEERFAHEVEVARAARKYGNGNNNSGKDEPDV